MIARASCIRCGRASIKVVNNWSSPWYYTFWSSNDKPTKTERFSYGNFAKSRASYNVARYFCNILRKSQGCLEVGMQFVWLQCYRARVLTILENPSFQLGLREHRTYIGRHVGLPYYHPTAVLRHLGCQQFIEILSATARRPEFVRQYYRGSDVNEALTPYLILIVRQGYWIAWSAIVKLPSIMQVKTWCTDRISKYIYRILKFIN